MISMRLLIVCAFVAAPASAEDTAWRWSEPLRLNAESETAVKEPKLAAVKDGGVHVVYRRAEPTPFAVVYRHIKEGKLSQPVVAHELRFVANARIAEALSGDIWLCWENWDESEQIFAARSTDAGRSWTKFDVTQYRYEGKEGGQAKHPQMAPIGEAGGSAMVLAHWRAKRDELLASTFDGQKWGASERFEHGTDNQYAVVGLARSPRDGKVYRAYGRKVDGVWQVCVRVFDGRAWGDEQVVSANDGKEFVARPVVAVNDAGEVMVAWDQVKSACVAHYAPAAGWSKPVTIEGAVFPALAAVKGGSDFVLVTCVEKGMQQLRWQRFTRGKWSEPAAIETGLKPAYTINPDLACDRDGRLHLAWEYWGSGNCQAWLVTMPTR